MRKKLIESVNKHEKIVIVTATQALKVKTKMYECITWLKIQNLIKLEPEKRQQRVALCAGLCTVQGFGSPRCPLLTAFPQASAQREDVSV